LSVGFFTAEAQSKCERIITVAALKLGSSLCASAVKKKLLRSSETKKAINK
jgi:hypothetical protein